jgi:hypothetical protein
VLPFSEEEQMTIQSSIEIGRVIRNAVVFDVKNWSGGRLNDDSVFQSVQNLFALLDQRQVDYVLVGGIALLQYVEGRNTQDIDLLMARSSLEKLPELTVMSTDRFFIRAEFNGLQMDVWLTENPLFQTVHSRYAQVEQFLDRGIPIATVAGLLLLKLYALPSLYRQGNFARVGIDENDIATLIQSYKPEIAPLIAELAVYVDAGDLAEIQNIVTEIQYRVDRFIRGQKKHE